MKGSFFNVGPPKEYIFSGHLNNPSHHGWMMKGSSGINISYFLKWRMGNCVEKLNRPDTTVRTR